MITKANIIDLCPSFLKNPVRRSMVKNGLGGMNPALISCGETLVHAGMWRAENMERWSKRAGKSGHAIIIEGDPKNFEILEFEKHRRRLSNVTLVHKAVWNEKGSVTFQSSTWSDFNKLQNSKTYSALEDGASFDHIEVEADTIDNILRDLNVHKVDHITLEVSGTELMTLEGMQDTINNNKGLRLFVRSILLDDETKTPMYLKVHEKMKSMGLKVLKSPLEKARDGCNLYGMH